MEETCATSSSTGPTAKPKNQLAVDGVVIVGEHGDYPKTATGQVQYPRYRFFQETVRVFRDSGHSVPVFNDKHLSWNWDWAKEMYDTSRSMGFPMMAGSSLPVTWRIPSVEMPEKAKVKEALTLCYGGVDSYDFHGLETSQCMLERRNGGEAGVVWLEAYRGQKFWDALKDGVWARRLFDAALCRSHTVTPARPGFNDVLPTLDQMQRLVKDPVAYRYQHADGPRATMILMSGLVRDFNFSAAFEGLSEPFSTQMYLSMPDGRTTLAHRTALVAENLFLRKQLVLFQERNQRAQQTTAADRFILAKLARLFDWRGALIIVKPATSISWHRAAFRGFWRWKSRPSARPKLPADIRIVIRRMAAENPTWGEERIADELLIKLGLRVSPRTVGKYVKQQPRPRGSRDQRWSTFVRNHADAIVACDFFVSITARFRILNVFVAMEIGSRRILHFNVTEHPTGDWTLQQMRETLPGDHSHRFLLHDQQGSFSAEVDEQIQHLGVRVLRSPVGAPTANAHCERLIGSIRRECLDFVIPIDEWHLRRTLREWSTHYNHGRPHRALGPGIPDAPDIKLPVCDRRHESPVGSRLAPKPVLGGLHHEYCWENNAA